MKQKIKTGMVAAVLLLCIAAVSMRYKWINEKYEKPEIQEYTVNETFVTDGMQVTLTDKNILEYAQLAEKYQISDTQMEQVYQAYPTAFLIAQYHIKNMAKEKKHYLEVFSEDAIEAGAFANGEDASFFKYLNGDWDGYLEAGGEKDIVLAYSIPQSLLSEKHWKNVTSLDYEIVLRHYPVKITIS